MNKFISLLLTIIVIFLATTVEANNTTDIVVVVNKSNKTDTMTHSQVIDLFMGKYVAFPNGDKAIPMELKENNQIKKQFYQFLVNMSLARVNSYWSRIKFSGRARPPLNYGSEKELIVELNNSENAIAYISRTSLNDSLKVVFEFHE